LNASSTALIRTCFGVSHEWHVEIDKSLPENDIGEKGLSCLDGVCTDPSSAWRPNDAVF
jgi:hypothetical protein